MDKLNNLRVQRLLGAGRPAMASDGKGLYLRIRHTGSASWTLRYRFQGRDVWMPLGDARDMSLAKAREEARAKRVLIDRGVDPLAERRAKDADAKSQGPFKALADRWYRVEIEPRLKHPIVVRRALDNHILKSLGRKRAQDITPGDCDAVLDAIRTDKPAAANDVLRYLRAIFAFARRKHLVSASPVADFTTRDAGGRENPRQRALTRDEIGTLLQGVRDSGAFGRENAIAVKLLLALCVRKGELLAARWEEFELDGARDSGPVWNLPAARTKTGTALAIPLAPPVVEWLGALRTLRLSSEYVFPARRRDPKARSEHVGLDTLNVALGRLEHDLAPFTLHDLRRTARTQLAALGVRNEVAERCLNHKLRGVEGTYNRHDYFAERREALTQWAALLCELEAGRATVVPIKGSARGNVSRG
jgi:integrase